MYQPFVDAALLACKKVAESIDSNKELSAYLPQEIGAGGDISIGFDMMAEAIFIEHLSSFGTISSEESGLIGSSSDCLIILDPVDGSDNLKSKFPYYGASIALQEAGVTVVGIVCNFANGDCFVRNQNEYYKSSIFDTASHETVKSHTYGRVGLFEKAHEHPDMIQVLMEHGLKFRSPGAVALSLAYAHYVKYVLFFGTMRSYDLEAGLFLCQELYCYQDDEILIISKEEETYQLLLTLFQRGRSEHSRYI
ncbi:MAG: inositol monophosphatase family protein [Campylobacterota bacterium]|nr:inositol monophosphatase family protein [Campylobacterota bacterium]